MKKRTVITTEKREIWIIRQPSGETKEQETDGNGPELSIDSLATLLDQGAETDKFPFQN